MTRGSQLTCRVLGTNHLLGKKWKCRFKTLAGARERESTAGEDVSTTRQQIEELWRCQIIKFSVGFLHTDARPSVNKPLWKNIRWGCLSGESLCWTEAVYPTWTRKRMYWFCRVSFQCMMGGWWGIQTYRLLKTAPFCLCKQKTHVIKTEKDPHIHKPRPQSLYDLVNFTTLLFYRPDGFDFTTYSVWQTHKSMFIIHFTISAFKAWGY